MTRRIETRAASAAAGPYAQAVFAGDFLFISGQIPVDSGTGSLVTGPIERQAECVLENIVAILKAAGLGPEHVVKSTVYLLDIRDFPAVNGVYARYFAASLPARACVGVSALPKGVGLEIEAVAYREER